MLLNAPAPGKKKHHEAKGRIKNVTIKESKHFHEKEKKNEVSTKNREPARSMTPRSGSEKKSGNYEKGKKRARRDDWIPDRYREKPKKGDIIKL